MKNILTILLLFSTIISYSQVDTVKFPPEGVYFTISSIRNGLPDLLKSDLHRSSYNADMTIRQWSMTENLYYNRNGIKTAVNRDTLWGYSENGSVYIYLGGRFHKISQFGAISYFMESYPTIKGNMAPVVTQTQGTSFYRMIDMETGELYDYNPENLLTLLEKDEVIAKDFTALKSSKSRKKKMYSFIERYNAIHSWKSNGK
jgi:hypothetical protein